MACIIGPRERASLCVLAVCGLRAGKLAGRSPDERAAEAFGFARPASSQRAEHDTQRPRMSTIPYDTGIKFWLRPPKLQLMSTLTPCDTIAAA
jgi:hypothetical protein